MKRFYKSASTHLSDEEYEVHLDGKPVRTPNRNLLKFPTLALAEASAAEWNGQAEKLEITEMPMTALAYATCDRVAPDPEHFIQATAKFAETDLLCYRAAAPEALKKRQSSSWDPLLDWFKSHYGKHFVITDGIMPVEQPKETTSCVVEALRSLDNFRLTSAHSVADLTGSVVIALAMTNYAIDATDAFLAAHIDDQFQLQEWGEDAEAQLRLSYRKAELNEIYRFLTLVS